MGIGDFIDLDLAEPDYGKAVNASPNKANYKKS